MFEAALTKRPPPFPTSNEFARLLSKKVLLMTSTVKSERIVMPPPVVWTPVVEVLLEFPVNKLLMNLTPGEL